MNNNWKTIWKQLSKDKKATAQHHYQYCILKALKAKSNNKLEIAQALLRRAFTPVTSETKLANGRTAWDSINRARPHSNTIFGIPITEFLSEEEQPLYWELVNHSKEDDIRSNEPDYLIIFVRQDISKEQQAVQAAHATFVAGTTFEHKSPEQVNFVLIGVEDETKLLSLECSLEERGIKYVIFREPDLASSITAIATEPLKEHQKRFLKRYKTLEF